MKMPARLPFWKWMLMLMIAFAIMNVAYFQKVHIGFFDNTAFNLLVIAMVTLGIILLYRLWRSYVEKRNAHDLEGRGMLPPLLKGSVLGIALYALCTLGGTMIGLYKIERTGTSFLAPWPAFVYCFMVGVSEEIVFRGIIFRYIDKRYNFWIALIISALAFGLAHRPRPWVNIAEIAMGMGVLTAVLYKHSGTLWLPIGVHAAWDAMCAFFDGGMIQIQMDFEAPLRAIPVERGFAVGDWTGIEGAAVSVILHLVMVAWVIRKIKTIR